MANRPEDVLPNSSVLQIIQRITRIAWENGILQIEELQEVLLEQNIRPEHQKLLISKANATNDDGSIRAADFVKFLFRGMQQIAEANKTRSRVFRFQVGTKVLCRTGQDEWSAGRIVALNYREPDWTPGRYAPYQVRLDDGPLIYVPMDSPQFCRELVPPWWSEFAEVSSSSSRMALREASVGKDVNQMDHNGMGILHVAATAHWLEGVDELISLKADVNLTDKRNATALHKAVSLPNAQAMVQKLCAAGANLNLQDENPDYDPEFTSTTFGDHEMHRTPLHYSSEKGDVDTMRILIEFKADVDMQDGQMKTPLHLAIEEDEDAAVDLLLQSGASVHLGSLQSGMKNSPLMDAAHCSKHALAQKLIEAGANVNQQGKSDMAAIHLAARRGDAKMVKILLSARAEPEQQSNSGTAVDLARRNGRKELLQAFGLDTPNSAGYAPSVSMMSTADRAALHMD
eukprot:TRINITY_DN16876_c0_g1_i1.p1 TRINITY_DN16876_c0_g1~~TRINITY_DN16876_c0_g1_i1.p1  ORF type:complete len:476 (-),score=79.20 TRINITY_DN16876_c0_g1_i1:24-1397(-)